jgi:ligand-binding sensor domain-containing protein
LWVGTESGLYRFNPETARYAGYFHGDGPGRLKSDWVKALYKDSKGHIWVGTHGGGLSLYQPESDSFRTFLHDVRDSQGISHNDILSIAENRDGQLWIGTENGGISVYNPATGVFSTIQKIEDDNTSINDNSIYCIYRDRTDNLWIGTFAGGVNFQSRFGRKFKSHRKTAGNENSLSNNLVLSICGDERSNKIWIGTDGGGLNLFDRKTGKFTHFRHDDSNVHSLSNDYVISVIQVSDDVLGLAYHVGGFDLFNIKTGKFEHYLPNPKDPSSLSVLDVNNIFKDRDGNIWLGTWKGGLNVLDMKTRKFTRYRYDQGDSTSISDDIVTKVFQDEAGQIWVGTFNGLNLFDPVKKQFTRYQNRSNEDETISSNKIQTIQQAEGGDLWIGTLGGGLNYFDRKRQIFITYTEKDGLASNVIHAIVKDKRGNLWMSTNNGVSLFDPKNKVFRNFGLGNGLQGNEFKSNSFYQAADGEVFFGGVRGFSTFHPDKLIDNTYIPPVYITGFQIFNKAAKIGKENAPLSKHILESKEIHLTYDQSVISFEFAALNYTMSEKNQYAYQLKGFDQDWIYSNTNRKATYTNLDPGDYVFQVKGANNDGLWNDAGTSLVIHISPPFWKTFWFRATCTFIVLGLIYSLYRLRIKVIGEQKRLLVRQVRERTEEIIRQKQELQNLNGKLHIQNEQEQKARKRFPGYHEPRNQDADERGDRNGDAAFTNGNDPGTERVHRNDHQ